MKKFPQQIKRNTSRSGTPSLKFRICTSIENKAKEQPTWEYVLHKHSSSLRIIRIYWAFSGCRINISSIQKALVMYLRWDAGKNYPDRPIPENRWIYQYSCFCYAFQNDTTRQMCLAFLTTTLASNVLNAHSRSNKKVVPWWLRGVHTTFAFQVWEDPPLAWNEGLLFCDWNNLRREQQIQRSCWAKISCNFNGRRMNQHRISWN